MLHKLFSRGVIAGCAALLPLLLLPVTASAQDFDDLKSNGNLTLRGVGSIALGYAAAPAPAPPTAEEINAAAIAEAQALIGDQIEANIDLDYRLSMMELGLI